MNTAVLGYDLALAGLTVGSAAALTGIGLIVTYRATGVLNLAHGAVAMICAYVLRQSTVVWGWPLPVAAAVTLLVVAPGIGLLLDRWVFRPLAVAGDVPGGGVARTLVASLGVFVLLVGAATVVWGDGARTDVPELLPGRPWSQLACVAVLAALVPAVARWTRFGRELRAVVDNRQLAVLSGIDANRVAAAGWAFGTFTAGLTGVLLAPVVRLDPYGLSLLVLGVMGVAVAARLQHTGVAVVVALAVGIAQSLLTGVHPGGWEEPLLQAVSANLFVVTLLVAALALPAPGAAGRGTDADPAGVAPPFPLRPGGFGPGPAGTDAAAPRRGRGAVVATGCALFLLPLGLSDADLRAAVQVPALTVILLSLVLVSGRAGQISLGQAAYAGLGALFTALLAAGRFPGLPALPELAALAVAMVLVAPLGLLTGGPAIRRRGLAPALVTLAFGMAVSRFVFAQPYATAGLGLGRPEGFDGDRAFYVLELTLLAVALLVTEGLRRGRTGRRLAAMRDHQPGAAAAGIGVPGLKAGVFVVGAALAALGGGMLGMALHAFDPGTFDPVQSLLWFAVVVVLGADSAAAAPFGAALLVALASGARGGVAAVLIGVLAVSLGRFPEGLTGRLRAALAGVRPVRPTAFGERVRQRLASGRPASGGEAGPAPPQTSARRRPAVRARPLRPRRRSPTRPRAGGRLVARGIRAGYQGFTVLDGVGIEVPPGQVTALIGPNGAGKTTLFDCLCGTLRPRSGRVLLDGVDVTGLPPHARSRLGLVRTFQQPAVFASLSVADNVRVGAEQGPLPPDAAVESALRLTGLGGRVRTAPAAGLPTGMLRRVELARALACGPRVLLLDEPGAGLDTAEARALARLLRVLAADGLALLVVEHDPELVEEVADTVHVLQAGRIVASGPPARMLPEYAR